MSSSAVSCRLWLLGPCMVLVAGLLSSLIQREGPPIVNYGATVYFSHEHVKSPATKSDIVAIVNTAAEQGQKVRVVGSGHSWSPVAVTEEILVSLWNYSGVVSINRETREVRVKAGTPLKLLNQLLEGEGLAMKNMGSISEQTVAGAISTATHGSGIEFGNMATLVTGVEFVNGRGELISVSLDNDPDLFRAVQVSIGMLGILTEVTFECEPKFNLREQLFTTDLEFCLENFAQLMSSGEHAKLWLELFSDTCAVFVANRTHEEMRDNPNWSFRGLQMYVYELLLFVMSWFPSSTPLLKHLIFSIPSFPPHDRVDISYGVFNIPNYLAIHSESEVAVPLHNCPEAIRALKRVVSDFNIPVMALNFLTEVRSVQADEIWLSPNYQRLSCHITLAIYNPSQHTRDTYFGEFYKATAALGLHPRPHWGKHMPIDWKEVEMEALFPRIKDFARIRAKMDPQGIFLSDFLNNIFKFV